MAYGWVQIPCTSRLLVQYHSSRFVRRVQQRAYVLLRVLILILRSSIIVLEPYVGKEECDLDRNAHIYPIFRCRSVGKPESVEVVRLPIFWWRSAGKPEPTGEVDIGTVIGISNILAPSHGSSPEEDTVT